VGQRNHVLDGVQVLSQDGQYEGNRGLAHDISGYVWWSVYSERVSRGQHWYDAYVDLGVLDGVHNLTNAVKPFVYVAVMQLYVRLLRPVVLFIFDIGLIKIRCVMMTGHTQHCFIAGKLTLFQ